ncbi:methyltransferase domain-containing protein [Pseudodesulfovibrio sp.]|nr:methyltransferase domain-containing protein [Pseudodesulfovibrio sp.]
MAHIAQDSLATIYFEFTWKSSHATHVERYLADNVSFTRDILPLGVKSRMRGLGVGDSVEMQMDLSEVPPVKPGKVLDMPRARFLGPEDAEDDVRPRIGRYYPKFFIENVPGTRPESPTPFRVVEADKAGFKADLNHPMAGREVTIRATVKAINDPGDTTGGLNRWSEIILKGPGMQARLPETPTDFLGSDPFVRQNEAGDADFYASHDATEILDDAASVRVAKAYALILEDGMEVLDLMAGRASHMPDDVSLKSVTGLGVCTEGMNTNPALTDRVVHNLNEDPRLPFADETFDAVVCTAGVEYLTQPFAVVEDVARVLKPGGAFALAFSTQWFGDKVIPIWTELYEFERMGLVSQYFIRTEKYADIQTVSHRNGPADDNGSVYMVYGRKA